MPSGLSAWPRALGNTGSVSCPLRSRSHSRKVAAASLRSGVQRSVLPLPVHRRWAPVPRKTCSQRSPINSETLSPVCTATRIRA